MVKLDKETKVLMADFLDSLRDYMHESHNLLCFDERESDDFVDTYEKQLSEGIRQKQGDRHLTIPDVNNWVACDERLPEHLQTVWLANKEKQWVCLGCLVDTNEGWHWAESNGVIYVDEGKIVSECESDDLDVTHWCALPEPPCR